MTIVRPRLPRPIDGTPVTSSPLEKRMRRADPSHRVIVEAHRVLRGDIKRRKDQWNAADSLVGLAIRDDGGLELTRTLGVKIENLTSDGFITDLNTDTPFFACAIYWGGSEPADLPLHRVTAYLDPANGGPKNVDRWRCTVYGLARVTGDGSPADPFQLELYPLGDLIDVTAGPSVGNVTFDFKGDIRPKSVGVPEGGGTVYTRPTSFVLITALKSDGTAATNVGWGRDSTKPSVTTVGNTIEARQLTLQTDGRYQDADDNANGTQRVTVDTATYVEATVAFTGANKPDLGAVPASASVVEFTVHGELPTRTKILGQARVGGADAWVTVKDGDTAAGVGLAASQTYQMRATLTPNTPGDATPILTDLGVREVTRTDLSLIATVSGGGWGFDPATLRATVAEVEIVAVQDGERDFRDAITELLATTHIGDLWFRVFVAADDLGRSLWYHVDDFYPDHVEGMGGALRIRAVNLLGTLKAALPKYDSGTQQRNQLTYTNQSLKTVYNDLLASQLAVPGRHLGAQVEDAATLVTKKIDDSDGKVELDAIAFIAGGIALGRQGKIDFVDVHGTKAAVTTLGVEDIAQETVTPGWSQRVPEFFVDYNFDFDTGKFRGQHRAFHADAITKLGRTYLDPPQFLDDEIARWIPTQALATTIGTRQINTLGTGMITASFRTQYAHPELWPGDLVAVRTDRLVARSPTDDRAIRGYAWVLGVVSRRDDILGTRFTVWVRRYSDIVSTSNTVTLGSTFSGASSTVSDGAVAAYVYRNTALALPNGLWRTALYDDDSWRMQKNTAVAGDFSMLTEIMRIDPSGKGVHIGASYTAPPAVGLRTEGDIITESGIVNTDTAVGVAGLHRITRSGTLRFQVGWANSPDSWVVFRYNDAGTFLGTALDISRATGAAAFEGAVSMGPLTVRATNPGLLKVQDTGTSGTNRGGYISLVSDDGAALDSGHRLGVLAFGAHDGSAIYELGGVVTADATGLWTSTSHPTVLRFLTTPVGSSTPLERMRITDSGNILASTTTEAGARFHVEKDIGGDTGTTERAIFAVQSTIAATTQVRITMEAHASVTAGTGTLANVWAMEAFNVVTGAATVTTMEGIRIQSHWQTGAGATTTYHALHISDPIMTAGSIGTAYGLRIESMVAAATNWAIHAAGGNFTVHGSTGAVSMGDLSVDDINATGQIRAKGWFSTGTGHALEIGVTGGVGAIVSYNRTTAAYQPLAIDASTITFGAASSATFGSMPVSMGALTATTVTASGLIQTTAGTFTSIQGGVTTRFGAEVFDIGVGAVGTFSAHDFGIYRATILALKFVSGAASFQGNAVSMGALTATTGVFSGASVTPSAAAGGTLGTAALYWSQLDLGSTAGGTVAIRVRDSQVAHGMTDRVATDVYTQLSRGSADGGLLFQGFTEATSAMSIWGNYTTDNTTKTTAGLGAIQLDAKKKSGTTVGAPGADANLVVIQADGTTRFIFDNEGSGHADVEWVTFDEHQDLALLDALEASLVPRLFGQVIEEHAQTLERLGVIHDLRWENGRRRVMLNQTRMLMLLTGAVRQLGNQLRLLEAA